MWSRLRSFLRVTAVRLSLIYTLIFGITAVGIVAYMTGATINLLRQQYEESINVEIQGLSRIYSSRGLRALVRTLDRRANAPGANLYIVANSSGEILAGNVPRLEAGVLSRSGWTHRPFRYERYDYGQDNNRGHHAIARVLEVPGGLRILVGRDIGETEGIRRVIRRGFTLALGTMVALGLLTWFFVGRRALKRIDSVSQSSLLIMSGDQKERLPISGSGDEFDRLSVSLNQMLDRIHALDDGLKQMSDNIAHDLKTPITRLRNKAEDALSGAYDHERKEEIVAEIISDCDQIVKTFDALLMISRVESGSKVANLQPIDLLPILADVHELYEAVAEDQEIELVFDAVDLSAVVVMGSKELLAQAVTNLLDNAMKYGRPKEGASKITIKVSCDTQHVAVKIADNGEGIPDDLHEQVRKRLVRLDESRNLPGNGLGLSLVDAIAQLHGGTLNLSDNQPGLIAEISIPLTDRRA